MNQGGHVQVIFLYGPMGVGKLTIGREIARLTGLKLIHNHLIVDLVTTLFQHESEAYFRLLRQIRQDVFVAASREGVHFVCTGVYRNTPDQNASLRRMLEPVYEVGGTVLFVKLTCDHEVWLGRVQSESRGALRKITDPLIVQGLLETFDLHATAPFEPHLTIDTTTLSPTEAAAQIAAHAGLTLLPGVDGSS
jgi:shikimate kinase